MKNRNRRAPDGQDRARARIIPHADAARVRRDAAALSRDRSEDQAPRPEAGPPPTPSFWKRPTRRWPIWLRRRSSPHGKTRRATRLHVWAKRSTAPSSMRSSFSVTTRTKPIWKTRGRPLRSYGDTILNSNEQHERYHKRFPEWYVKNRQAFEDNKPRAYPVDSKLAVHLIDWLMDNGFDPASSKRLREGRGQGPRHGLCASPPDGGTQTRSPSCQCSSTPTSHPTSRGRSAAISSGRVSEKRSRVMPAMRASASSSGGLSHFLVDEDFDRAILKACADKDATFLQNLPRNKLNASSSGNPQLGPHRRRARAPRPELVRICRATARRPERGPD